MNKLLDQLKQIDPTTYKRYNTDKIICDMELVIAVKDAWLQACLQEVISTHGWLWKLKKTDHTIEPYHTTIHMDKSHCKNRYGWGNSPVKSLLASYIAACEAMT
jgi:hypothetical protein